MMFGGQISSITAAPSQSTSSAPAWLVLSRYEDVVQLAEPAHGEGHVQLVVERARRLHQGGPLTSAYPC